MTEFWTEIVDEFLPTFALIAIKHQVRSENLFLSEVRLTNHEAGDEEGELQNSHSGDTQRLSLMRSIVLFIIEHLNMPHR